MFDHLDSAVEGDEFFIQVAGHKLKYVVDEISVVLPHEVGGLQPVDGQDYVTLVTCTPYGINTHRLLVRGHQVPLDDGDEEVFESTHGPGWQWWMLALLGAVVVFICWFSWWMWRRQKDGASHVKSAENDRLKGKNYPINQARSRGGTKGLSEGNDRSWEQS